MSKIAILMVDDDEIDRMSYKRFINKNIDLDVDILEASSGEEGLKLCRTERIDCIILDYHMPSLNGIEFLDLLYEQGLHQSLGVVLLTGQDDANLTKEATKRGVNNYLVKSKITLQRLNNAINNVLEQNAS